MWENVSSMYIYHTTHISHYLCRFSFVAIKLFTCCNLQHPLQIQIEFLGDQSESGGGERGDNISDRRPADNNNNDNNVPESWRVSTVAIPLL